MKKAKVAVFSLILMFVVVSAVASASELWPGWFKSGGTQGGGETGGTTYSVVEPAAIVLLGAGLVSLGIYAKRKRSKKQ